nr:hypothetical protein Q903MT_gene5386 [Picea sitchensis]
MGEGEDAQASSTNGRGCESTLDLQERMRKQARPTGEDAKARSTYRRGCASKLDQRERKNGSFDKGERGERERNYIYN